MGQVRPETRAIVSTNRAINIYVGSDDLNQAMMSRTTLYGDAILDWCLRRLSNHHNPSGRAHDLGLGSITAGRPTNSPVSA